MGKDYVKFNCHSCVHCCTEVVCLPTPWDVERIVRETGEKPKDFLEFLTPEEIEGVDDDDPTWLEVDDEKYMMALKRGKRGCYFLNKKTRLCGIYESRPLLCRLYPFKLDESKKGKYKGFSLHKDVGCPKHTDGKVATAPLYEIYLEDSEHHEDYDDLVKIFNRKEYENKRPMDFVKMFLDGIY